VNIELIDILNKILGRQVETALKLQKEKSAQRRTPIVEVFVRKGANGEPLEREQEGIPTFNPRVSDIVEVTEGMNFWGSDHRMTDKEWEAFWRLQDRISHFLKYVPARRIPYLMSLYATRNSMVDVLSYTPETQVPAAIQRVGELFPPTLTTPPPQTGTRKEAGLFSRVPVLRRERSE